MPARKPKVSSPAPAPPIAAPATATHVANHVHAGPACTDDAPNASCASHPGPRLHCFEIHLPFIGTTVCSCVHAVL